MLKNLSLILIITATLWATNHTEKVQQTKKPPVDEGNDLKPVADKVKGVTFADANESNSTTTLSLEKEDDTITIKFKRASHVPLTCKVLRDKKEVLSISKEPENPRVSRALKFEIQKNKLQAKDEILISNSNKIQIKRIEVIK